MALPSYICQTIKANIALGINPIELAKITANLKLQVSLPDLDDLIGSIDFPDCAK